MLPDTALPRESIFLLHPLSLCLVVLHSLPGVAEEAGVDLRGVVEPLLLLDEVEDGNSVAEEGVQNHVGEGVGVAGDEMCARAGQVAREGGRLDPGASGPGCAVLNPFQRAVGLRQERHESVAELAGLRAGLVEVIVRAARLLLEAPFALLLLARNQVGSGRALGGQVRALVRGARLGVQENLAIEPGFREQLCHQTAHL